MPEFVYAIYISQGEWKNADTLYLIKPDRTVKRVANACENSDYKPNEGAMNHLYWELIPGETFDVPDLITNDIKNLPNHIFGTGGPDVTVFELKDDKIKKLWSDKDFGQIDFIKKIEDRYNQLKDALKQISDRSNFHDMILEEIKSQNTPLGKQE